MTPEERKLLTWAGFQVLQGGWIHDPLTDHLIPLYRALQIARNKLEDTIKQCLALCEGKKGTTNDDDEKV